MMQSGGNDVEFDRHTAAMMWDDVVGPTVAAVTTRRFLEADALHVCISSGPIKSELAFILPSIIERINNHFDHTVIRRIILH